MALKSVYLVHGNGDVEIYSKSEKVTIKFNQRVQMIAREIDINPTRKFIKRFSPNRHKEGIRVLCHSNDIIKPMQRQIRTLEKEIYDITNIPVLRLEILKTF